jgi:FlaG/FlaF family flagellin (archaellin)
MSLRMFHIVFIAVSVVLAAFLAAWAVQQYQSVHAAGYVATAVLSVAVGGGLIVYGTKFQRKTRTL